MVLTGCLQADVYKQVHAASFDSGSPTMNGSIECFSRLKFIYLNVSENSSPEQKRY
jgi:hypothetical protein